MRFDGGQLVVEMLKAYGVEYVFGVPGDTSLALYDALARAHQQGQLAHILARDERSAGYMADAYARVSFRPGVTEAPSGAGATYLAAGLAEAHASSIPVIALTSDIPLSGHDRNVLTALDQSALFAPITKWCTLVKGVAQIPDAMRQAFRVACTGRPGAVQVTLPSDVLSDSADVPPPYAEEPCRTYPAHRSRPDPAAVQRAAAALLRARRPVIVAGGGVVTSGAWSELGSLAEELGAPVGTSICGKGAIDESHRLSLGVVGDNGGRPYANAWLRSADLILFIGCRTDSVTTEHWTLPPRTTGQVILHADVDPLEIGRNYQTEVGLVGDARLSVADLLAAVRAGATPGRTEPVAPPPGEVAAFWSDFEAKAAAGGRAIKPQSVIKALRGALPAGSVIVADAGTPTPFLSAYFPSGAGRQVIIPRGFGGLGYAIPAVIGAKLGRPQATVVGVMGDGSFGMSAGELETLGRLGLPVTIVQFNNGCFGWIKVLQELYREGRYFGVDFCNVDYAAIARGFGLMGTCVREAQDVEPAMHAALTCGGPAFVDVVTESEIEELPPVARWQKARKQEEPHA